MRKNEHINKKMDAYKHALRSAGLKATPSRLAVLEAFGASLQPLSSQMIIECMPKHTSDRATIYRIVAAFNKCGIIRQIDLRHNHAHYELAHKKDHHHLVCLSCGRVEEIEQCELGDMHALILARSKHFEKIKEHALEFYGTCKRCMSLPAE